MIHRESLPIEIQKLSLLDSDRIFLLNEEIFHETRLINHYDHPDLILLIACVHGIPIGFKVGYGIDSQRFYSAKGGVLKKFRRKGVASQLLLKMEVLASSLHYELFEYDTYPEKDLGMYLLGKKNGFVEIEKDWNQKMKAIRVRLQKKLTLTQR